MSNVFKRNSKLGIIAKVSRENLSNLLNKLLEIVLFSIFQVSNMFIMSLAIADLIVGVIVMPISAAYAITGKT